MSHSIYPLNPYSLKLPLIVFAIGYENNQPPVIRKDGFPMPQLFICLSGEGTLIVNGKAFIITEGSFFFLFPNIPHEYYGNTDPWEVYWIAFSGTESEHLLSELNFHKNPTGLLKNLNAMEALFKRIFLVLKTDENSGKLAASSALYEIFAELYAAVQKPAESALKENDILNTVRAFIDLNYNKTISLEELSGLVHMTPQYLCRLFKKHMNMRPFQYIAMTRIQHAKKLLSDKSLSIAEVAQLSGYDDCSYFCSVFKRYERISPSEFRSIS